jgi:ATP-binding cassette subfamily B protein
MAWSSMRADRSVLQHQLDRGTVRRILTFARPYRGLIAAFLVTVVIDAVLVVATPLLFSRIIDDGVLAGDSSVVINLSLLVALIAIASAGVTLIGRLWSARIGEGLIFDLRTQVFAHVQRMPLPFFTRTQTGALISRLNSDVIGAQQAFTSTLSNVVSSLITLVLVVIAMLSLSWQITLGAIVLLPLFLWPAKALGRRMQQMTRRSMELNADMSAVMTERFNVSGALLSKLYGRPEAEDVLFADRAAEVRDIGVRIAFLNRIFFTALTLVAALATALVYGVGGVLTVEGALTVGTLVALAGLLTRLYGPLTALSNVRIDVMTALVSFDRVFEVLDLPPLIAERPDATALRRGPTAVEFRNVDFRYPSAQEVSLASLESVARLDSAPAGQVLRDVSFTVPPGRMVALVGPSGAGKTTITSLVPRLYDVNSGEVIVGGHDVRDVTLESLHAVIGVVTQDAHLFHDTIGNNLRYARPDASDAEVEQACRDAQIYDLIASLPDGLDTVVGDRGYRLSGGEKQRIAIARLLLKAPDVVILDEATAHLDSESERAVQLALETALSGRTSVIIAHRLSTVRHADEILCVVDGRIAERGRHDDLIAAGGIYADLYTTQFAQQPITAG